LKQEVAKKVEISFLEELEFEDTYHIKGVILINFPTPVTI